MKILALRLFTNRGRKLQAQASKYQWTAADKVVKDGVSYEDVKATYIDAPMQNATVKGFFGRSNDDALAGGILRLGIIWGDLSNNPAGPVASVSSQPEHDISYATEKPILGFVSTRGGFYGPDGWASGLADRQSIQDVKFTVALKQPPRVLHGLCGFRHGPTAENPLRVEAKTGWVSTTQLSVTVRSFGGSIIGSPFLSWTQLPESDSHLEAGYFDTYDLPRFTADANGPRVVSRIGFARAFARKPVVCVWLTEINVPATDWVSVKAEASNITSDCFDITAGSWQSRPFDGIRLGWFAYDPAETNTGVRVKTGAIKSTRGSGDGWKRGKITYEGEPFTRAPHVFVALRLIDTSGKEKIPLDVTLWQLMADGFNYSISGDIAAADFVAYSWTWIAIQS